MDTDEFYGVARFVIKLYKMVSDKDTNSIISWGSSGASFIIFDEHRFTSEILPSYFDTSRLDSFTTQLNNYGFNKTGGSHLEFEQEHFQEGKQHLLKTIKRRSKQSKVINNTSSLCVATNEFKAAFGKVCVGQKQNFNRIQRFKLDMEKTLSEVQNITKSLSSNPIFTFSKDIGGKRKFGDLNSSIVFADIEKDFEAFYNQFEVPESGIDDFRTLRDWTHNVATGRGGRAGCGRRVPDFLQKLYNMVEKQEIDDLISWKLPSRDSFIIWDTNKFATHEFKKVNWECHEYANEWFLGGREDLLQNITRRPKKQQRMDHTMTCTLAEMEMLTHRLKTIQQEQKSKITWISYYEEQMRSSVDGLKEMAVNMANITSKLTLKSIENLEHVKKAKLVIEDDFIGSMEGQTLEVNELGEDPSALEENNNDVAESFFQELELDYEAVDKYLEMDETWIVHREITHYLSAQQKLESD
ncbi:winged helix-turn-helix DNA-binding domain, Heat shock transcription factor family [Artemisia annua]|uniref:Winged helix-turn-helix DNA-binding domain, Heat shock transcription factor family n=1 Tax=Artemisia annua TaxID=35608 RepID=A0A2U1M6Y9_ARTAN|nr:winged helix-turn-helix DNA-binding domain, Heat shock transcription factor family [Artemisia annua]